MFSIKGVAINYVDTVLNHTKDLYKIENWNWKEIKGSEDKIEEIGFST